MQLGFKYITEVVIFDAADGHSTAPGRPLPKLVKLHLPMCSKDYFGS